MCKCLSYVEYRIQSDSMIVYCVKPVNIQQQQQQCRSEEKKNNKKTHTTNLRKQENTQ